MKKTSKHSYLSPKGYVFLKMPEHHRANEVGYVFEHIVVLEKKLGRKITVDDGEVHHKDRNRSNNHPDNLELLSMREHRALHKTLRSSAEKQKKEIIKKGRVVPKEKLPRGYYYLKII